MIISLSHCSCVYTYKKSSVRLKSLKSNFRLDANNCDNSKIGMIESDATVKSVLLDRFVVLFKVHLVNSSQTMCLRSGMPTVAYSDQKNESYKTFFYCL